MKPLVLKPQAYWRTRLEQEAAAKNVSATDLLHLIIAERYTPNKHNPFDAIASIPRRMLEVERWHGLSVTESAQSLTTFGIKRVADLSTPDKLLERSEATRHGNPDVRRRSRLETAREGAGGRSAQVEGA